MRIGEASQQSGVSRDTIRFYESHGLITSEVPPDTTNGYRVYAPDTVPTLMAIKDAQAAGLSISDIAVIMGRTPTEKPVGFDVEQFLNTKIVEVIAQLEGAARFLTLLQKTRQTLGNTGK